VKTVAVTAGYINPEPRAEFYRCIDAANVDLKGFTEDFYRRHTASHLEPVLDTLKYLRRETDVWLEITMLLIPGENDSREEIDAMTRWIARELGTEIPLHFSAFHPDYRMLGHRSTPKATLQRARAQALANGLKHVYVGNVRDPEGETTFCAGCGAALIGRDAYELTAYQLDASGACRRCARPLAGRFAAQPGHWGRRRMPVAIEAFA
jgi:pyruvate formate lyase activating enzyme